jgi:hypothetical protein
MRAVLACYWSSAAPRGRPSTTGLLWAAHSVAAAAGSLNRTAPPPPPYLPRSSRQDEVTVAGYGAGGIHNPRALEPGVITHLTRLTRLCTRPAVLLPNDPAALPSAGGSLRVLELYRDAAGHHYEPGPCIEALLPVAAGLEALGIDDCRLTPADAARLAAALPQDIPRLQIKTIDARVWSVLPVRTLELEHPPADLALLAAATRLEWLSVSSLVGADLAALAAALQALPRLQALQLGSRWQLPFEPDTFQTGQMPTAAEDAAWRAAQRPAEAVDAFVAAVAGLPALRELTLSGFHIRGEAEAALLEAAPRLSSLRLAACGMCADATAALAAQLRVANGALSLEVGAWP